MASLAPLVVAMLASEYGSDLMQTIGSTRPPLEVAAAKSHAQSTDFLALAVGGQLLVATLSFWRQMPEMGSRIALGINGIGVGVGTWFAAHSAP